MPFSDSLDTFQLPPGFKLPDWNSKMVAYMDFFKGLRYEKLKKALILRMEIERLIQQGQLREFTREIGHDRPQGRGASLPRNPPYKCKNSPPRNHPYQRPRTDKKKTERGLEMPHDDALVIVPKIAHYTVERMETYLNNNEGYSISTALETEVPIGGSIGEMTGDQKRARVCYQASVPPVNPGAANQESRRKRKSSSKVNTMTNRMRTIRLARKKV
ncbi:hypothetical protein LIER_26876 [Lithospermum erythrorhizon]|uniref:Uncharacterized protein n=1 Tax=Lithospermum erythrorhizon TaxID=34254 RepID=A0AAV3RBJ7_LITER